MIKNSLLIVALVFLIASCTSKSDKKETTEKTTTPPPVEQNKEIEETDFTNFKFDKSTFKFGFTGYGAKEKTYAVSGITFDEFTVNSSDAKLKGTSIAIKLASINSSADLNNGLGGEWPESIVTARNMNILNGFVFQLAEKETVSAKVIAVDASKLDLEVALNGVTKTVAMTYKVNNGVLSAEGKIDVLDFNASEAFNNFSRMFSAAFHQGKSWSDVTLTFTVKIQ